jgi:hypothetical protein
MARVFACSRWLSSGRLVVIDQGGERRVGNEEHGHVALPKLYGAPAYARPPRPPVEAVERPFDPDELPIEAARTDEERELVRQLHEYPSAGETGTSAGQPPAMLRGRPFSLKAIADRFLERRDGTTG